MYNYEKVCIKGLDPGKIFDHFLIFSSSLQPEVMLSSYHISIKLCLHWRRRREPVTMTCDSDTLVLALATLGEATEIEMILIGKVSK